MTIVGMERNNLELHVKKELSRILEKVRRNDKLRDDEFHFILAQGHEKDFPTNFPTNEQFDFLLSEYYQKTVEELNKTGFKKGLEAYGVMFALECKSYDFKRKASQNSVEIDDFEMDILTLYLKSKRQTLETVIHQTYTRNLNEMKKFGKQSALTRTIKERMIDMLSYHQGIYKRLDKKNDTPDEMIMQLELVKNNYHESTNQLFNI